MCCYRGSLVFKFLLKHDISQGSIASHLRLMGFLVIITKFFLIWQRNNFFNRFIVDEVKAYKQIVPHFWATLYICGHVCGPFCRCCTEAESDASCADSCSFWPRRRVSCTFLSTLRRFAAFHHRRLYDRHIRAAGKTHLPRGKLNS